MDSYRIENLSFAYPTREEPVLKDISLNIGQGDFITICGSSGCGKTSLLRQLKPILTPHGKRSGQIFFMEKPLWEMSQREQSENIGFVAQSPDNQIVTDKVWHELAFGLESLGMPQQVIRLRVAEMASFFGIQNWFYRNVSELSGGQKQLLNLASVMVMQPSVLILDEPTSQLDPIAAADFLDTVVKINQDLGVTVAITEHRLEEIIHFSDRIVCMDHGKIICMGTPSEVGAALRNKGHGMFLAMPTPMRVYAGVPQTHGFECPVTIRDGREWLRQILDAETAAMDTIPFSEATQTSNLRQPGLVNQGDPVHSDPPLFINRHERGDREKKAIPAIELDEVWFRYEKESQDVLKGLTLKVNAGDFFCVLGGNGAGKTTALSLLCGANLPYRGKVKLYGKEFKNYTDTELWNGIIGALPQNPQALFVKKTVYEDLLEVLSGKGFQKDEREKMVLGAAKLCHIEALLNFHPYDLSGGEQQRAALAKVLLLRPGILLLDEPTKGLDAEFKAIFAGILNRLNRNGVTIIMVSHDIEFCAEHAINCALIFDGCLVSTGEPREFFAGNSFYTTAASRMARGLIAGAVTVNDIVNALGGVSVYETEAENIKNETSVYEWDNTSVNNKQSLLLKRNTKLFQSQMDMLKILPTWRKVAAGAVSLMLVFTMAYILFNFTQFKAFISGGDVASSMSERELWTYSSAILAICIETFSLAALLFQGRKKNKDIQPETTVQKRRLSKRTLTAACIILLAVPLTIYIGMHLLNDRRYYFISMMIILETLLPFIMVFEGRKPKARELVIISVLCAIGAAGRTVFFMLPQFKPVTAMVIIAGVAFGAEAGFLVGAITAFTSNMFFGQGPWTAWQMFAFGIIGFLAGILFRKGSIQCNRASLCVFGGLTAFVIYGGIMNSAMVLMYQDKPVWPMFAASILQGIPFDIVHAAATVMFLWLAARPLLEKLERIKVKYGLIE